MTNTIIISVLPSNFIVLYVIHENCIFPLLVTDDIIDKMLADISSKDLALCRDILVSALGDKFYTMHYCLMVNGEIVDYMSYDEELVESEVA